ncbi:unnamed protein product [Sphagnum balticum]
MHLPVFAHAFVWLENGNHQSRAENHQLGNVRHESELNLRATLGAGQVQEEIMKLKIINRSGMEIQLVKLVGDIEIGEIIIIAKDKELDYAFYRDLSNKSIRLDLPHQECIYLNGDFMEANKIAYVRKGDGDCWFVDPICRAAKLVRKRVCNSTTSQIALVEFVFGRSGETTRVAGKDDHAIWTACWETIVAARKKNMLIVDPEAVGKKQRIYFGRGGDSPSFHSTTDVNMLRRHENIHEIEMASHHEHVEVKVRSHGLDWTSSWRPPFLV